jgi:hypothetical protein
MKSTTYVITGQSGRTATASSLAEAKRVARGMCVRNVGSTSNMMTSGTYLPARRLYWQAWCDGTIIGDPERGYNGDNPMVAIRKA